jgi:hypothetical protein
MKTWMIFPLTGLAVLGLMCFGSNCAALKQTSQVAITSLEECAQPEIKAATAQLMPVVQRALVSLAEDQWGPLLSDLETSGVNGGKAVVACAVKAVLDKVDTVQGPMHPAVRAQTYLKRSGLR